MTNEPSPLASALAPFAERLKAKGLEVGAPPAGPTPVPIETPADAAARRLTKVEAAKNRWAESIPPMYAGASVADLGEEQHGPRIQAWLMSGSLHLVLAGAVGTGKTYAAYAVGNQAISTLGLAVEAWNVGDLLDALRPGSTERDADRRARRADVLILDDLLAKATDWEAERLTLLLDDRVRNQRRTIVTTNVTSEQITETWGARFMDRLRYRLTPITFTGESRRGAW